MTDTRIHPVTGNVLHRDIRSHTIVIDDKTYTVDVPGWYPDDDSDSVHSDSDLEVIDQFLSTYRQT